MRFLLDVGISPKTAGFLRSRGHDAVHLYEQGLERLEDHVIMEKARGEGRVLVAHDLDFPELIAASKARSPSVMSFAFATCGPKSSTGILRMSLISTERR